MFGLQYILNVQGRNIQFGSQVLELTFIWGLKINPVEIPLGRFEYVGAHPV